MGGGFGDCCVAKEDVSSSGPQHAIVLSSLPKVVGPLSPTSHTKQQHNHNHSPANPYQVLQIRRDATAVEIRQSYKHLALWHHPGRSSAPEERRRRFAFFNLLAACYETLIHTDSRRRYDSLCRQLEQAKLQAGVRGAMFVGGKPLLGTMTRAFEEEEDEYVPQKSVSFSGSSLTTKNTLFSHPRGRETDLVPPLSRASSGSTASLPEDDNNNNNKAEQSSCCGGGGVSRTNISTNNSLGSPSRKAVGATYSRIVTAATITTNKSSALPQSLADSSCSSDDEEEEAETHFTESTTQRLFGGPLSHLFKARNFEPFSDPYDVFEKVFGSQPFRRVSREEIGTEETGATVWPLLGSPMKSPTLLVSPSSPRSPAGWRGESKTSPDGKTTVFTTSRVLHDRILTRTEIITRLPGTKPESHISVTAEPLMPVPGMAAGKADTPTHFLCHCTIPESRNDQEEVDHSCCSPSMSDAQQNALCGDFCQLYDNAWNGLDFSQTGFFQEWQSMFPEVFPAGTTRGVVSKSRDIA